MKRRIGLFFGLLREAGSRWIDDGCYRWAASLAYYALFSLFPLMLLVVTILGFVLGDDAELRGRVVSSLTTTGTATDKQIRVLVDEVLTSMQQHTSARGVGLLVGAVTLIFGASAVFQELNAALDHIWRLPVSPSSGLVRSLKDAARERLHAFGLVALTGLLLLGSLATSTTVSVLSRVASDQIPLGAWAWQLIELGTSTAFLSFAFAALFRTVPQAPVAWGDVWAGGLLTALFFTGLRRLIAWYLAHATSYAAYGAVGAIMGFLTWVYLSSLIVFLGAEFTRVYAERFGSLARARGRAPARLTEGASTAKA